MSHGVSSQCSPPQGRIGESGKWWGHLGAPLDREGPLPGPRLAEGDNSTLATRHFSVVGTHRIIYWFAKLGWAERTTCDGRVVLSGCEES